ncbi:MAG: FkbM family methyltransferase [Mycobacterium sp.]
MESDQSIKFLFRALVTQIYRRLLGSLYLHVPLIDRIFAPIINRGPYRIRLSRSRFAVVLYRHPKLVREDEQFLQHFLKPGMTYVDVGANIGTTTLMGAHAVGSEGEVVAFEPHPRTFDDLQKSVALNQALAPRIRLIQSALGDEDGETHLSDLLENDVNHIVAGGIAVPITTLDEAVRDIPHIDLLKVDVEGYEKNVFLGATDTLARTDAVYFESSESNFEQFGYSADDVFDILSARGFSIYTVDRTDFSLREAPRGRRCLDGYENLLALSTPSAGD